MIEYDYLKVFKFFKRKELIWQNQVQYLFVVIVEMNHQNGSESVHGCNQWNTCYEEKFSKQTGKEKSAKTATPTLLNDIKKDGIIRTSTGFDELDRVLGGGLVKGSLILLRWRTRHRKIYFNTTNV